MDAARTDWREAFVVTRRPHWLSKPAKAARRGEVVERIKKSEGFQGYL